MEAMRVCPVKIRQVRDRTREAILRWAIQRARDIKSDSNLSQYAACELADIYENELRRAAEESRK